MKGKAVQYVKSISGHCFPLFKAEDKPVYETVMRLMSCVGLNSSVNITSFPGQQDCQMGFGDLMADVFLVSSFLSLLAVS